MPWRRPCATVGSTVSRSLARIAHVFDHESDTKRKLEWRGPPDIPAGLKQERGAGKNIQAVPQPDKKNPIGWVDAARRRAGGIPPPPRPLPPNTPPNKRVGVGDI